jgi:hypothetical protein
MPVLGAALPADVGLRLLARAHGHDALGIAADAVGVREREAHFVLGTLVELEHAAREHVRRRVVQRLDVVSALVMHAQQRQALLPVALAGTPVSDRDGRVAVGVALDVPLEA